jgi:arginine-tRNA-protein transferase
MADAHLSDVVISSPQAEYDTLRFVSEEYPCPYIPGLLSRSEAYYLDHLDGSMYERLLALGFRRCGRVVYRPRCRGCSECRQLRVPVTDFTPTRSMLRVARRNSDLAVRIGRPLPSAERFEMYQAYLDAQHDGAMVRTYEAFSEFLYDSPTDTYELCYVHGERVVSVSLVDLVPHGLSSVYVYFDPGFRSRSLGTFSVLWEIDYCKRQGLTHYYLGYFVADSGTMSYKSRFRPNEVLDGENSWVMFRE